MFIVLAILTILASDFEHQKKKKKDLQTKFVGTSNLKRMKLN